MTEERAKKGSTGLVAAGLLLFFLPFFHVSCGGVRLASFSGVDLVTGTSIEVPSGFGSETQVIPGNPFVRSAAAAMVCALLFSLVPGALRYLGTIGLCGASLLALLAFRVRTHIEAAREGEGLLKAEFTPWFWLIFLGLVAAAGLNYYLIFRPSSQGVRRVSASGATLDRRPHVSS